MSLAAPCPSVAPPELDAGRAARRLADAEAEFDAALQQGVPREVLMARDHEVELARAQLSRRR